MKKFQFAAGLLALGMLASCSSDAPDAPNSPNVEGEKGEMCMAIRLTTNATRAEEAPVLGESEIVDLQVTVLDGTREILSRKATLDNERSNDGSANHIAKFEVSRAIYNDIDRVKSEGRKITIKVTANAYKNEVDDQLGNVVVTNVTWSPAFLFTGESTADVADHVEGDGTETKPWRISANNIELVRLASKFTMDATDNEQAKYDTDLNLTVAGMAVETWSDKTYWTQTETTPGFEKAEALGAYKTLNYSLNSLNQVYRRPIIATGNLDYLTHAHAAIKVKISSPIIDAIEAGATDRTVWAYKGYLVGTIASLNTYEADKFKFEPNFADGVTDAEKAKENEIAEKITEYVNDFLRMKSLDASNLQSVGFMPYNPDENGNYYTYYVDYIYTEAKNAPSKANEKGNVYRNNVYKLHAASFKKLGVNEDTVIGQNPEPDSTSLFIDLQCTVKEWGQNENEWNF